MTPAAIFATGAGRGSDPTAGSGATERRATGTRIGLVLARQPATSEDASAPYIDALIAAARRYGVDTETLVVDASVQRLSDETREKVRHLDLVVLGGAAVHERFVEEVPRNADTHFVFLDPSPTWAEERVNTFPNSTDIFFIEGPASYLAGYLGALLEARRVRAPGRLVVSVVAGDPSVSKNLVGGFRTGVRDAVPRAVVLERYSHDVSNPTACRKIANRQIDRGSRLVFAAAGTCSLGALSAAEVRGVRAVGVNVDRADVGSQVVASVVKHVDRAVEFAIRSYLDGTLEAGSLDIGIERQAVGIADISPDVPAEIRRKVEQAADRHAKEWASWSTPRPRRGPG